MGLGLYPIEDVSSKALQGVGQAAQSYGAMGQARSQTTTSPGPTAGGAIGAAAGMGMAGFAVGGPIGGAAGAAIGAAAYLFS
ncbi:hypothetical protein [Maridesulfovibrio ferrireducens]|uniref:hypothetical protein n=1 Tax=Maridesulfovibrio ferrireducens TaxID=246191 RepID=UPI001A2A43DE|nr:hypothetical protein [Maridesulfovibrio ferrireducens]MBI9113166.1 hypothetical protein [Maridesulfovibrio ferrireducens]